MCRDSWGGLIGRADSESWIAPDGGTEFIEGTRDIRREGFGGFIAAACLALTACAHTPPPEPKIQTVEVKVPVPVPCTANAGPAPSYADDALDLASSLYDQVKALLVGREQRKAREKVLEGAVVGCGGSVK